MAIALDNSNSGNNSGMNTTTVSLTVAGSDRILIVGVADQSLVAGNVTGVTYNGVSMTQIDTVQTNATDTVVYLYGILAPSTGTNNIVASRTIASDSFYVFGASYTGVDQGTAIGSLTKTKGANPTGVSQTTFTGTLTTPAANCWLVMCSYNRGQGATASTNAFNRQSQDTTRANLWDSNGAIASAGSTNMTINQNNNWWGFVEVTFAPVTATGPANLKSYDGNVKSNIKSMNGNLLANVKSFDGNS